MSVDRRRSERCVQHDGARSWLRDPCTRQVGHDAGGRSELCVCLSMIRQAGSTPCSSKRAHAGTVPHNTRANEQCSCR